MHVNMAYPKDKTAASLLPKSSKAAPRQKPRAPKGTPLDPNDLTRRLYIVLAEQKAYAEKKQRAKTKAEAKAKQSSRGKDDKKVQEAGHSTSHERAAKDKPVSKPKTVEAHSATRTHKDAADEKVNRTGSAGSNKEREDGDAATYRHVPQVAASQFTRTTTVETLSEMSLTHKLSKKAIRFHKDGLNASREMATVDEHASPSEHNKALKRAQSQREKQYERNQFQHPAILEVAAGSDDAQPRREHWHDFESRLKVKGLDPEDEKDIRRRSTGSMLGNPDATRGSLEIGSHMRPVKSQESCDGHDQPFNAEEHRVDWTQSDEIEGQPKSAETSPLRKTESKWTLRARLGSFTKHGKDDKGLPSLNEGVMSDTPLRSPKSGFFSRFKR